MNVIWHRRGEGAIALASGLLAAAFLWSEGTAALVLAALVPVAVVAYRRRPVLAALGIAALMAVDVLWVGIPSENPGLLAAFFVVVYGLGRYGSRLHAVIALVGFAPAFAAPSETRIGNIVFALLMFGMIWTFGYLVRRRATEADLAASVAAALVSSDPRLAAAHAVAEERARLAGDTLAVIRSAVGRMKEQATASAASLDPAGIVAIQDEGRRATRELRRLLGLLRSEPANGEPSEPVAAPRRWRSDVMAVAVVAVLMLLDLPLLVSEGEVGWFGVVLAVALAATVLLRRVDPSVACLVAILPLAVALALDVGFPQGVWLGAVGVLLAWGITARVDARPREYLVLAVFIGVMLLDTYRFEPANLGMTFAVVGVAAVAGHLWAGHGRQALSATTLAEFIRTEHEEQVARAVRSEQLRLARELHDVTSHSVGVMVLQAGAAAALRESAPDQARAALRNVQDAGVRALSELSVLFGLLDAGAIGAAGHASATGYDDLIASLEALAARMRQTGLRVTLEVEAQPPDDPAIARTAYRVVQESLTNAARYAPQSAVDVKVASRGDVLEVIVRDDGQTQTPIEASAGAGFGLVGLEERVRAHGGDVVAGPRPGGGFEVVARIPTTRPAEVPS